MRRMSEDPDGPTPAIIQSLLNTGVTQAGIARMFGVSRQAIHDTCKRYGLKRQTRQEMLADNWPFKVPVDMGNQYPFQLLRDHLEYMMTNGKGMAEDRLKRLRSFYQKMRDQDLVLEFDPNIPPEQGVSPRGGFAYRKRRKSDRGLLIRVNGHTDTNTIEQGRHLWTFPDNYP